MKTMNIEALGLQNLSKDELTQISGGSWIEDVAYVVGFCVGYIAAGIIAAAKFLSGNL